MLCAYGSFDACADSLEFFYFSLCVDKKTNYSPDCKFVFGAARCHPVRVIRNARFKMSHCGSNDIPWYPSNMPKLSNNRPAAQLIVLENMKLFLCVWNYSGYQNSQDVHNLTYSVKKHNFFRESVRLNENPGDIVGKTHSCQGHQVLARLLYRVR